jgi:hypothetical protein
MFLLKVKGNKSFLKIKSRKYCFFKLLLRYQNHNLKKKRKEILNGINKKNCQFSKSKKKKKTVT